MVPGRVRERAQQLHNPGRLVAAGQRGSHGRIDSSCDRVAASGGWQSYEQRNPTDGPDIPNERSPPRVSPAISPAGLTQLRHLYAARMRGIWQALAAHPREQHRLAPEPRRRDAAGDLGEGVAEIEACEDPLLPLLAVIEHVERGDADVGPRQVQAHCGSWRHERR